MNSTKPLLQQRSSPFIHFIRRRTCGQKQQMGFSILRFGLVAVVGATGTGKSKLAIDLALKLQGEIISADSMQVYKGLDIITNKVSKEERTLVRHHLLDYVDPLHINYTIHDFKSAALPILEDVIKRKKIPIIVGGTNYYIEALLWNVLIQDYISSDEDSSDNEKDTSSTDLHKRLEEVDPEMAKIIHPNDRRKILRSLQVYKRLGRPHTHLIEEQKSVEGGSTLGGPLRFKNSCIFWIQCDQQVLNRRLDERVDEMIKIGLVEELHAFHQRYNQQRLQENSPADYTNGIFQSIGFKEFHDYLVLDDEGRSEIGPQKLKEGVETLKQRTQRYAKKQLKWINNRFLRYSDRQVPPIFALDATNLTEWNDAVLQPALNVLSSLQKGETPPMQPLEIQNNIGHDRITRHCQLCGKIVMGENQWKDHLKSRSHQKLTAKERRKNKDKLGNSLAQNEDNK